MLHQFTQVLMQMYITKYLYDLFICYCYSIIYCRLLTEFIFGVQYVMDLKHDIHLQFENLQVSSRQNCGRALTQRVKRKSTHTSIIIHLVAGV